MQEKDEAFIHMGYVCYNSYLEIDLGIIQENYRFIRRFIPDGTEIIPVLKQNAYGFGAVRTAQVLCREESVKTIALAQVGEAVELREAGVDCELLVLGAFPLEMIPIAVENDLTLTVFRPDVVKMVDAEAQKQGKTVGVHIKIETGLNRTGVLPGEPLAELLEALKRAGNTKVRGVFSHFISGEEPDSPEAKRQLQKFLFAAEQVHKAGWTDIKRHICNSGAIGWYPEAYLDAVRIGQRLYMDSRELPLSKIGGGALREAASWRTTVTNLHTAEPGETVGYNGEFAVTRPTVVATIGVGYGDGLSMNFGRAGSPVLVNGQRARYIGMCMDQCMLDVTDIACSIGDEVTILGRASNGAFLSAQELAATVGYDGNIFIDFLSSRVERRYING